MTTTRIASTLMLLGVSACRLAMGAPAADTSDDRIALSGSGSSLTGTNGGGGASVGWIHNFDADRLAGAAVEHQVLSVAQWTFGSLLGSLGTDWGAGHYNLSGEIHEGAGADGGKNFHYRIEAVAVSGTYFHRLTAQLEDRRIDVEATHGNLPKLGLSFVVNPHLVTTASFSSSVNGNLGTHLGAARVDYYGPRINLLAGVAYGQASAAVLNLGINLPGKRLKEGYTGFSVPFPRARGELALIADYQDLETSKRVTVTLNYIFHVGHRVPVQ